MTAVMNARLKDVSERSAPLKLAPLNDFRSHPLRSARLKSAPSKLDLAGLLLLK